MTKKPVKAPYVAKAVAAKAAAAPAPVSAPAVEAPVAVAAPVVEAAAPVVAAAPAAFEVPKVVVEAQDALRETATKSLAETRTTFEKAKTSATEINGAVESSVSVFAKGLVELNGKVLGALRSNSDAALDLFKASFAAKSPSELVTLQLEHARKQLEIFSVQAKDFSAAATKLATDATQPLKAKVEKALAA